MYLKMTSGQHNLELSSTHKTLSDSNKINFKIEDIRKHKVVIKPTSKELEQMVEVDELWHI